jgi:thiol-disulfide isomerase/thioredoxin
MARQAPWFWKVLLASAFLGAALVGCGPESPGGKSAEGIDPVNNKDHLTLIGWPAPDFPMPDFAINGKPATLADLKGKVVLLDFWAVWCDPCIKTFPHLRELDERYRDKGLQIVGLTEYSGQYGFDKQSGQLMKLRESTLNRAEEQAMLKDFVEHYQLPYLIEPLPQEVWRGKVWDDYRVGGIPTVVLIDRKGFVRLVREGGGEKNAKDIEAKIKELVAEK